MASLSDKAESAADPKEDASLKQERTESAPNLMGMAFNMKSDSKARSIASSVDDSDDNAGARLDALSLNNTPDRGQTRYLPRHNRSTEGNHDRSSGHEFQLGQRPSGDVFLSSLEPSATARDKTDNPPAPRADGPSEARPNLSSSLATPARALRTRASNTSITSTRHHVGGVDAQGVYPPTACVFVANLPEPRDDQSLEAAVTREFSKYGTVFVKIRRDTHHMPFAFCQYTKDEDAMVAMDQGKGALILGRACRTEMVKANRVFYIHRRRDNGITLDEARAVLEPFGAVSRVEILAPRVRDAIGAPAAVLVEFATFDPGRDLHSAFRHNDNYRVEPLDVKKSLQPRKNDADEMFLNQYEVDRRSVFVGGLSPDVEESVIEKLFSRVGTVVKAQLIKKPVGSGVRSFAFVEFDHPEAPEAAIATYHDYLLGDFKLRVERKVIREHTPRRVRSQQLSPFRSPGDIGGSFTPSTPDTVDLAKITRVAAEPHSIPTQSPTATAQANSQAWNWVCPPPSPAQATFSGQGYVGGGAPSPFGVHVGGVGIPMTPQATPGPIGPVSPYTAYYNAYWPGMGFVQDPMAAMAYYAANASPTTNSFSEGPDGDNMLDTPTRADGSSSGPPRTG